MRLYDLLDTAAWKTQLCIYRSIRQKSLNRKINFWKKVKGEHFFCVDVALASMVIFCILGPEKAVQVLTIQVYYALNCQTNIILGLFLWLLNIITSFKRWIIIFDSVKQQRWTHINQTSSSLEFMNKSESSFSISLSFSFRNATIHL
jgi:hypothetical protein